MKRSEIRDLAFWITLHESDYSEGVQLAKEFISSIVIKKKKVVENQLAHNSLETCVQLLDENNINRKDLSRFFDDDDEHKPDFYKTEEEPLDMPEADSY